ncbi:MAG: LCP family protein [Clostridia bacterium]|nr:LCP family protein [Clostridia bacterium]
MRNQYYDDYAPRPRRAKPVRTHRRAGCLSALLRLAFRLAALIILLTLLGCIVLYFLPVGLLQVENDASLSPIDGLPTRTMNVLILGVDALHQGSQRSDAMLIASIGGGLKLTSLQRDIVVPIEGYGDSKLNAAYAHGGAVLAVRTVNQAFLMNILRYVVVDYAAVVRMVDALGGIELDITQAEMVEINKNVWSVRSIFAPMGYTATELKVYGENVHLDGLQALGYARIRSIDSDFGRTNRQRRVIHAMLRRLQSALRYPNQLRTFVQTALETVQTNLTLPEALSLGAKALFGGSIEQLRLPVNGSYIDNGSTLQIADWAANVSALRQFIYGE